MSAPILVFITQSPYERLQDFVPTANAISKIEMENIRGNTTLNIHIVDTSTGNQYRLTFKQLQDLYKNGKHSKLKLHQPESQLTNYINMSNNNYVSITMMVALDEIMYNILKELVLTKKSIKVTSFHVIHTGACHQNHLDTRINMTNMFLKRMKKIKSIGAIKSTSIAGLLRINGEYIMCDLLKQKMNGEAINTEKHEGKIVDNRLQIITTYSTFTEKNDQDIFQEISTSDIVLNGRHTDCNKGLVQQSEDIWIVIHHSDPKLKGSNNVKLQDGNTTRVGVLESLHARSNILSSVLFSFIK